MGTEPRLDRRLAATKSEGSIITIQNRLEGAVKKAVGTLKEATRKAVGNTRLEAKDAAQKNGWTVQNKVGKAQDKS